MLGQYQTLSVDEDVTCHAHATQMLARNERVYISPLLCIVAVHNNYAWSFSLNTLGVHNFFLFEEDCDSSSLCQRICGGLRPPKLKRKGLKTGMKKQIGIITHASRLLGRYTLSFLPEPKIKEGI